MNCDCLSQVLCDAGDLTGSYEAAEALVGAMPTSEGSSVSGGVHLDLVTARMISGREDCSDRSLGLFVKIADRLTNTETVRTLYTKRNRDTSAGWTYYFRKACVPHNRLY